MVSVSEAYVAASPSEQVLFESIRIVVASARNWAHYLSLIVGGFSLLVFYAILFRFALVPRVLAGLGLAAILLQLFTLARPLFGQAVLFPLLAPVGLIQLALALWLLIKGFRVSSSLNGGSS